MSQGQPRRGEISIGGQEPIKYGDVFEVSGELAGEVVKPEDAAMMQAAETVGLGHTQPGGPAAVMQSAAKENELAGIVSHDEASDLTAQLGVSVTDSHLPGLHQVTESVAAQVVAQYPSPAPPSPPAGGAPRTNIRDVISIGEALEAVAFTAGDKPVSRSDAAAIQAAEARVTGGTVAASGGLAAEAQAAASANELTMSNENKITLSDVLSDASRKLVGGDKEATREDAERVVGAEMRNNPAMVTHPGGVVDVKPLM
ncbi:late embryogenesis abundant protein D-34-like [Dioscorea cayenensis subsp. rotundata]|uniref:Late embryogenesis abundant protein D-34-like n=1 Tax=Dioscorea cayennensis subsp. rotundata TaxID=55577 RepID=A0AB40CDZ0_DIOCR|nr:late embryogenesis abundant protein D-34-like [Dioscorea cayenensis subsp. rotundata]